MTYPENTLPLLTPEEWIVEANKPEQGEELPTILHPFIPPFVRGRATVLGADTEVGKTAFALQAYRNVIDGGHPAAYCTLEMTPADLFQRFQPQFDSAEHCKNWIIEKQAYISQPYIDVREIESIIKTGDFHFVVIDHIHELPFDGHEELARKVRRLASLAPAFNTSLLMLSQMKRPDFDNGEPTKHDYSWTKAIAEVASVALALYRERADSEEVLIYNLKNRFGAKLPFTTLRLNENTITFERVK